MSQNPKGRAKDTKKAAEKNLRQAEPLDKQDPTKPVKVKKAPSNEDVDYANDPHVPL